MKGVDPHGVGILFRSFVFAFFEDRPSPVMPTR